MNKYYCHADYAWVPWYLKVLKLSGRRIESLVLTVLAEFGIEFCGYCDENVIPVFDPNYVCRVCWEHSCGGSITKIKETK